MKRHLVVKTGTVLAIIFFGCGETTQRELPFKTKQQYEETMIASHQAFLKKEKEKIEKYIHTTGRIFDKTGTGLQIAIYDSTDGDSIKTGDIALIKYKLTSIKGDSLYASPSHLPQEFAVDYDNVESGLHEGIKRMKVGEKALLILPAHLAHGITGDQAAIPSQTTLVYDLHLVGKR